MTKELRPERVKENNLSMRRIPAYLPLFSLNAPDTVCQEQATHESLVYCVISFPSLEKEILGK